MQSDWFLYLRPTSEQNKMASRFGSVTEEELLFNKQSRRARQYQKNNEFGNKVFKDMYFFSVLFSDKCTQDVFKMLCLQK